jgi:hypothetical protein
MKSQPDMRDTFLGIGRRAGHKTILSRYDQSPHDPVGAVTEPYVRHSSLKAQVAGHDVRETGDLKNVAGAKLPGARSLIGCVTLFQSGRIMRLHEVLAGVPL